MHFRSALWVALGLTSLPLGACHGCDSKTPVPFKRTDPNAARVDVAPADKPAVTIETSTEASSYPEGTQNVRVSDTLIERPDGTIRASLARDLDADGQPDVMLVTTDAQGQASLETVLHGGGSATARIGLAPYAEAGGCRAVAATLGALGRELAVASVDFLCDVGGAGTSTGANTNANAATVGVGIGEPGTATNALPMVRSLPLPNVVPVAPSVPLPGLDLPPPEPGAALAQTHHFVVDIAPQPHQLLQVAADTNAESAPPTIELSIAGADTDGDEHSDIQVALQLTLPSDPQPLSLTLTWLSRPSGLARDRQEPERSLGEFAKEAWRLRETKPQESLVLAKKTLLLHHALCRETGRAKLWIDAAPGLSCGASSAAGKAAAARAIALAKTQAVLLALEARAELDDAAYQLDPKTRDSVTHAVAAMHGETDYRWQQGPALSAPAAPNLRLPALGFIDEEHVLMRGPIAQSYDLLTHAATPTGMPGSVLAADAGQRFVLVDIVRTCDGYHLRVVPAGQVIGGIVTGASTSEPLLEAMPPGPDASSCSANTNKKSNLGGFSLLSMLPGAALLARGATLTLVPLDEQGHATTGPRTVATTETIPTPLAPGALDASTRYFALTTNEGVTVVDRANPAHSKLVRPPPSCNGGQVSDAALSPSGRKIAMLCAGHLYLAEPAADSGSVDRPTAEHP